MRSDFSLLNKDEPHLFTNIISKVYLTSLRPYYYYYCSQELLDR